MTAVSTTLLRSACDERSKRSLMQQLFSIIRKVRRDPNCMSVCLRSIGAPSESGPRSTGEALQAYLGYRDRLWRAVGTGLALDAAAFATQDRVLVELGQRMDANATRISDLAGRLLGGTQNN